MLVNLSHLYVVGVSAETSSALGPCEPRLLDKELILEVRGTELQRRRAKSLGRHPFLRTASRNGRNGG